MKDSKKLMPAHKRSSKNRRTELQRLGNGRNKHLSTIKELKKSNKELTTYLKALPDIIFVMDAEGRYLKILETSLLGALYKSPGRLIGKNVYEIFPADKADLIIDRIKKSLARNKTISLEYEIISGRRKLWFSGIIVPLTKETVIFISRDITGQKQIESTEKELQSLFRLIWENSIMGMRLIDDNGTILMVNDAFCRMVGKSKKQLEGKLLSVIYNKERHSEIVRKHRDRFKAKTVNPYIEQEFILWNNEKRWFGVTNTFLELEKEVTYLLGIFRDITEIKSSEEALIESEKRFRLLFENSAESFCIMTERFEECNEKMCELFGCSREEIVGHSPWEFSPEFQPDGRGSRESALEKINAALNGIPQYFYWQHKRKDNALIDIEVSLKKFSVDNKSMVQATLHDITERTRYEKIQNALYKISEAVITTDDMHTLYSKIHDVIKGLMSADNFYIALYDEYTDLMSFPYFVDEHDTPPAPRKLRKGLTEYVLKTGENMIITKERDSELRRQGILELIGEASAIWLGVTLKLEGKTIGVMAVQDYNNDRAYGESEKQILEFVSEQIALAIDRKQTAEELIKYTWQLKANSGLLEERAQQLTNLNKQLEESEKKLIELNSSKDKLFSIIAHDLKSPFQPLIGMSEILANEEEILTGEERTKFKKDIYNAIKNQYKLLENLLDWSRLQTGRLDFKPVQLNLAQKAGEVIKILASNAFNKNISISNKIGNDIFITADEYMLHSVFQNIITNSIKFTNQGGNISLSAKPTGKFTEIEIADNGIGMSAEDIRKVFRTDTHHTTLGTAKEKGTGLGLMICKEMIAKNGGEIRIESKPGEGTKFIFTLQSSN